MSDERFRRYFDLGLVGMVSTAPDKSFLDVNDRLCEMLGYERSELMRTTWAELTHPADLSIDLTYFNAVLAGESEHYTIDKRFIRKDGTLLYATISVGCVRHKDGTIDHLIGLVQDITQRKLAENELHRREKEFKALVEDAGDVISRFGSDLRHIYVNPAIKRITGLPPSHFLGKTIREAGMSEELALPFETALRRVFATGEEQVTEFTFRNPAGDQVFHGRIVPEFGLSGEVEFALSITRDITEIRNSESRLKAREAQLATAQRIANLASWEMDLETGRRFWSREVFRLMGMPPGEPPPEHELLAAIPEQDRDLVIRTHQMAIETGRTQAAEHRITIADGSERVFSLLVEPQKNASQKVVKLTGTVQDVTELRRAERALRQSDQRMRDLIESANDAILTLDTTGKVLEVNPATVRMMGEPADVLVGRHITQSIHPDHVQEIAQGLATVIATGNIAHIEAPVRTGRGDYIDIEATASRQSREGADAIFVIGRDVTERRRAETERRTLTKQIELLLESTYEGILSVDVSGDCTLVNRAAAAMLGYSPADLLGNNLHDLLHNRRSDGTPYDRRDCPILRAGQDAKPVQLVNEFFWRRNGTMFPVEIFISPILGENSNRLGMVVSFIDVSERRFLQAELERANRLTSLGRVAATMSHEFNNVLMGIQPFAEVVMRSTQEPKVIDAAKRIVQSVQRGRRVTSELQGFTRPVPPVRQPVEVHSWLHDCVTELRKLLPRNITFEIEVADGPMSIEADSDQMTQVVSNIVLNARDAIGSAIGSLKLGARIALPGESFSFGALPGDQPFIHFSVTDNGPGIAPENLARITEPFFSTKRNGTGLGLAITQQIITLHGGHMFVESKLNAGTSVHFFLTAMRQKQVVAQPEPLRTQGRLPLDILLIEDEDDVAAGLIDLLAAERVKVLVARDGAAAMKLLETNKPQALVIDIGLPDCDGFKLFERITERYGPIPAVFSSGHADPEKLGELGPGVDVGILTKPYLVQTLLDELEQVCAATDRRRGRDRRTG
jgi:PAS domain S-box-containing protein